MRVLLIPTIAAVISIPCAFAQSGSQGTASNSGNPTKSGPQNNGGRSGQSSDSTDDDRYITPKDGEAQRNRKSDRGSSTQSGSQKNGGRSGQSPSSTDDDQYITPKDGEGKRSGRTSGPGQAGTTKR